MVQKREGGKVVPPTVCNRGPQNYFLTHVFMQKSTPSFLFLSTNSRRGTKMGPGRGGLIKNPNKALQPLVARGKAWAQAFHRPSHQGALTNISVASACPWLHYPFRRDRRSNKAPQCCLTILSSCPLQPHPSIHNLPLQT